MQELLVISGKGGTGKTSIVGSFAALAKNTVLADCDVDAANLHLLLHPEIREEHAFYGLGKAVIDTIGCTKCGKCVEACRFDAIHDFQVDVNRCEGCQVCVNICPVQAVEMHPNHSGDWFISGTKYGPFVHAKLGIAEENSGKLVSQVRKAARQLAEKNGVDYLIVDGPPGIGCPVISSLTGVDLALVVTEPSVAGLHDLRRVLELSSHFRVKALLCINKYDLDLEMSQKIQEYALDNGVELAGLIPFDTAASEAVRAGLPLVEYSQGEASQAIKEIYYKVIDALDERIISSA